MTRELHLGLIGLGEVGQVLASDLHLKQGVKLCAWDRLFALDIYDMRDKLTKRGLVYRPQSLPE